MHERQGSRRDYVTTGKSIPSLPPPRRSRDICQVRVHERKCSPSIHSPRLSKPTGLKIPTWTEQNLGIFRSWRFDFCHGRPIAVLILCFLPVLSLHFSKSLSVWHGPFLTSPRSLHVLRRSPKTPVTLRRKHRQHIFDVRCTKWQSM